MELGGFLTLGALLLIVIMFIARPFFDVPLQQGKVYEQGDKPVSDVFRETNLRNRYADILDRIDELEEDYQLKKIPYDAYHAAHIALIQEGTEFMQNLQAIDTEHEIQQGTLPHYHLDQNDEAIEEMILEHRKKRQEKMIGFCPRCGKPVQKSDVFCSRCGNRLERS